MKTEHVFNSEETAREAWQALDLFGRQRNGQFTVAFRDGRRVYIRPEYASAALARELESIAAAIG